MHLKQIGVVTALLWLAGCATPGPSPDVEEQLQEQTKIEIEKQYREQIQELELEREREQKLTASRMLAALERIASVKEGERKQAVEQIAEVADLTAEDRFELLFLLSQKGAGSKELKQALRLLDELEPEITEPSVKEVLRLQRHRLKLEQLYRKERRKSAELKKKIEHLKGLEQELDESNERAEEPLEPKPEQTL